jgi:hypothetical protein
VAGAAGQLLRGHRRALDDRGDLVERDGEQVVEHERHPFRRRQPVEDHEQREPHRLGQLRLLLRAVLGASHGAAPGAARGLGPERLLGPRPPGAQYVEAHPGHHPGQPAAQVANARRVGAAEPHPGLLDGVVGLGGRPEHAVGDSPHVAAMGLEALRLPVVIVHRSPFRVPFRQWGDQRTPDRNRTRRATT